MTVYTSLVALLFVACLDARPGRVGEPDDPADPGARCAASAPIARVASASDVGAFAVGPCGAIVYWHEGPERELRFSSPEHEVLARHPDPNGYSGRVTLSPSGHRAVLSSLRSDLGFGDTAVGDVPRTDAFAVADAFDFGGSSDYYFDREERLYGIARPGYGNDETWLHIEGGADIGPVLDVAVTGAADAIFYVIADGAHGSPVTAPIRADDGTDATLVRHALSSGATSAIVRIRSAWLDGSTVRTREEVRVSGDGARVVVGVACDRYAGIESSCGWRVDRVLDGRTGAELARPTGWRAPMAGAIVGPGPIVAAEHDDGVAIIDERGEVVVVDGRAVVAIASDQVLVTDRDAPGGALYAVFRGEVTRLVDAHVAVSTASGGQATAIIDDDGGLWIHRGGELVRARSDERVARIAWTFDDGVVLATGERHTIVVGPDGATRGAWDSGCVDEPTRRGVDLWLALCDRPNDELHHLDLASGRDTIVAAGHDFMVGLDASGDFVAFTFTPLSGTRRELHAGRVSR